MAFRESDEIKFSQIKATIKDLFDYLSVKSPVTTKDHTIILSLWKSLTEGQCFKDKHLQILRRNPLDDLLLIRNGLKAMPKTITILKTWLNSFRASYNSKLKIREDIEGIKILLDSNKDPDKSSHAKVNEWLKSQFKRPNPEFDKVSTKGSLIASVFTACKNGALPLLGKISDKNELKEGLKKFMTDPCSDLKPKTILAECGIDSTNWEDYVNNEQVFNLHPSICLPYVARMLEINIEVLQYPGKEKVTFSCDQADNDVTILLCVNEDKYVELIPIDLDNVNLGKQKTLKEKIVALKERVKILEEKLKSMHEEHVQNRNILENELIKTKQELEECLQKFKVDQERLKMEMEMEAVEIAKQLFNKFVKTSIETGSDYESPGKDAT